MITRVSTKARVFIVSSFRCLTSRANRRSTTGSATARRRRYPLLAGIIFPIGSDATTSTRLSCAILAAPEPAIGASANLAGIQGQVAGAIPKARVIGRRSVVAAVRRVPPEASSWSARLRLHTSYAGPGNSSRARPRTSRRRTRSAGSATIWNAPASKTGRCARRSSALRIYFVNFLGANGLAQAARHHRRDRGPNNPPGGSGATTVAHQNPALLLSHQVYICRLVTPLLRLPRRPAGVPQPQS